MLLLLLLNFELIEKKKYNKLYLGFALLVILINDFVDIIFKFLSNVFEIISLTSLVNLLLILDKFYIIGNYYLFFYKIFNLIFLLNLI